jgi:hypothetical protein
MDPKFDPITQQYFQVNDIEPYHYPKDFSVARACESRGHPCTSPAGGCAVDAASSLNIGIYPCHFESFFGHERFVKGWFTYLELFDFFKHYKLKFVIKQNGRLIRLEDNMTGGVVLFELVGQSHWCNADIISLTGLKFRQVACAMICISKAVKRRARSNEAKSFLKKRASTHNMITIDENISVIKSALLGRYPDGSAMNEEEREFFQNVVKQTAVYPNVMKEVSYEIVLKQTPLGRRSNQLKKTIKDKEAKVLADWAEQVNYEEDMLKLGITATVPEEVKVQAQEEITPQQQTVADFADTQEDFINMDEVPCCKVPKNLRLNNLACLKDYRKQFKGQHPDIECLMIMLKVCKNVLQMLHSSPNLPSNVGYVTKKIAKTRHDIFAYIMATRCLSFETSFGTDAHFTNIDSNRTPDMVVYDESFKCVTIVEFSVVGNMLRGNFLKGIDDQSAKYSREINLLRLQGWDVRYLPILLSTSSTIDENNEYWKLRGVTVSDSDLMLLDEVRQCVPADQMYLLGYAFDDRYNKHLNTLEETPSDNPKGWTYQYFNVNRAKFYESWEALKNLLITDSSPYRFLTGKRCRFIQVDGGPATIMGHELRHFRSNQIAFYCHYRKIFQGKVPTLLTGTRYVNQTELEDITHGINLEIRPEHLNNATVTPAGLSDSISASQVEKIMSSLYKMPVGDLASDISEPEVEACVLKLKTKRLVYKSPNNLSNPPILNDPRRSFYNMFDSTASWDYEYKHGIKLDFPHHRILSLSAKLVVNLSSKAIFNGTEVEATGEIKDQYQSSINNIYQFINSLKLGPQASNASFKRLRTQMNLAQQAEFDKLRQELSRSQRIYTQVRSSNKNGIVRLPPDVKQTIKHDMKWGSKRGYRLYMGADMELTQLTKIVLSSAKGIAFKTTLPMSVDVPLFKELKTIAKAKLNNYLNETRPTNLFNFLVFHSRLCYTLLAASNQTFSSDYVKFDNLGLTDVCLMVKGGKKITSTRQSKIFKLIYPCLKETHEWNINRCFYNQNQSYEETPWSTMHQNELLDGIALPYKFLLNYCHLRSKVDSQMALEILSIPTLLALHNRRKTEQVLHNMRYILVNCISEYSQVGQMILEFSHPGYSPFDATILNGLETHYMSYFRSIREWSQLGSNDKTTFRNSPVQHPYINRQIYNVDDLSYIIYSTYMMSKGAYKQSLEQSINLKSVMETHEVWKCTDKSKVALGPEFSHEDLYNNDFSFSPHVSYAVGKALSAELKKNFAVSNLHIQYQRIMSDSVDSMANNRGLRYKDSDYFGHKGYYVVYKELLDDKINEVLNIINSDWSEGQKYRHIKAMNRTFASEQGKNELQKVTFHIVDKVQRGGSREIYVMDYVTKLYQHPIEKMFKLICRYVDNEIITIPSSRRTALIYRKNFEYKNDKYTTYFLSFDCRKWAPRSNPDKYLPMIQAMTDCLPGDFIDSVKFYFNKHSCKEITTRSYIYDQLNKRTRNKYKDDFTVNDVQGSASFIMPYSFVMGIFNMLSSLYHAGVQILAKKYIFEDAVSRGCFAEFDMLAHSDDSGGNLSVIAKDPKSESKRHLGFYQNLQKSANHLMSTKKCNTSKQYFELLSTLYLNDELLPLLPKFLSNFTANFTGMGISADFKQIISKSIELSSNGATAEETYMCQLIVSSFYRNFYRLNHDTTLPALGGTADSWPTLYLAFGSIADEIRVSIMNPDFYMRFMNFALNNLDYDLTDGTVNLKMSRILRVPSTYRQFRNSVKLPEFQDNEWFFGQNKTRNSILNLWWFRAQIDNNNFAISMLNINEIRRAFDSLYAASGDHILGKTQKFNINDLYLQIMVYKPETTNYYEFFKKIYRLPIDLYEDMSMLDEFNIVDRDINDYKPCQLTMTSFNDLPLSQTNSLDLAVHICRPELISYLHKQSSYGPEIERMKSYLKSLDIPLEMKYVKSFIDFVNKFQTFTSHFYMKSSRSRRVYQGLGGVLDLVSCNYSQDKAVVFDKGFLRVQGNAKVEFDKEILDLINANYLYVFYKEARDDSLNSLPVSIGKKKYLLREVPTVMSSHLSSSLGFMQLIGHFDNKSIVLKNYDNWAFWSDRQVKIAGEWLGDGEITMMLSGQLFVFTVRHNEIREGKTKTCETRVLDDVSTNYFHEFVSDVKLNYFHPANSATSDYYLGLNKDNQFGIHDSINTALGVKITQTDWLNEDMFHKPCNYQYADGSHIIKLRGINYKLHTLDELIFKRAKSQLFSIIDWETLTDTSQAGLLTVAFSGNFGFDLGLDYDPNEVKAKFRETELYALLYNEVHKKKESLSGAFWNDILSHVTSSEDLLPVMFETSGLNTLQKLIPESKKDLVNLYQFYEYGGDVLFEMKRKMANFENESQAMHYCLGILGELGNNYSLATLPEVGDESEFNHYKFNKPQIPYEFWVASAVDMSLGILSGYNNLPVQLQVKYSKLADRSISEKFIYKAIFGDMLIFNQNIVDYRMLTRDTMILHTLLDEIFNNKIAFVEFSRSFRKTSLRKVPRHPRYRENWQILLANMIKYFATVNMTKPMLEFLPATFVRTEIIDSRREDEFEMLEIEEITGTPVVNLIYKTEPLEVSFYEKKLGNVLSFSSIRSDLEIDLSSYEEVYEEATEEEFERVRRPKYTNLMMHKYARPTNFSVDGAISTRYFMPLNGVFTRKYRGQTWYLYNANEDKALEWGYYKSNFKFELSCEKYLVFYDEALDTGLAVRQEINVVFDSKLLPDRQDFLTQYAIENPEIYTEDFAELFSNYYKLNDLEKDNVKKIIALNRSPITKGLMLRKLLRDKKKVNTSVDKLVLQALSEFGKSKTDIKITESIKLDFAVGGKHKDRLVLQTTSYKSEYQQLKCLIGESASDYITGDIVLRSGVKRSLLLNVNMSLEKLKRKDPNKASILRLIKEVLLSCKEGQQNNSGNKLDDFMRDNLVEMFPADSDEEDDDFEPPIFGVKKWRIKKV